MQQRMRCRHTIFCTLHLKGLLTLLLMTLAETVQFENTIHMEKQQQQHSAEFHHHHRHEDTMHQQQHANCPEDSQTCSNPLEVCYQKCRQDPTLLLSIPRGGHSHSHHVLREVVASTTTPYNLPLTAWKIAFQVLLTGINILCWLIPLYGADISSDTLSYMNAFSGGVFLTLAMCHLIPDAASEFTGGNPMIPYMFVLFGYMLIFFVEKIAFGDAHEMLHIDSDGHSHSHDHHSKESNESGSSAVILLAALSVHSILEMMALGLARSFTDSAVLTGSIALHQPAESIALLIAFLKTGKSKKDILLFLSAFSLMGPIGVAIGILVQEYAPSQLDSIVLAIVAGTFVYVGATEVIPEEFDHAKDKYKKFSFLLLGIAAILGITQYTMSMAH